MNSCLESLETRRLFSVLATDQIDIQTDQRALLSALGAAIHQEARVRNAIHTDLNVLHLLRSNAPVFAALNRQEIFDLNHLNKDMHVLIITAVKEQHQLLATASSYNLHQNTTGDRNVFNASLARFQQDRTNDETRLTTDLTNATTGAAAADLNAIAALAPGSLTLQSDVLTGTTNLTATATTISTEQATLETDSATLINDSSNVEIFGSENLLGANFRAGQNPFAGSIIRGLTAGQISIATAKFAGPVTITPAANDFAGTDQVYVGSTQTPDVGQLVGPQVLTLDYGAVTQLGRSIRTFTLGLATDGFENPTINSPYTATVNGVADPALSAALNSIDGAGRVEQFVSVGIDPALLSPTKILTITIDGPGGSGWAVDFATVGINNG